MPRVTDMVAAPRSTSVHFRPSNSLRRTPVVAASQSGEQPVPHGRQQECLELVGGPCLLFDLQNRPQPGSMGHNGHIPGD